MSPPDCQEDGLYCEGGEERLQLPQRGLGERLAPARGYSAGIRSSGWK
jgi:hypothetical protein